MLVLPVVATMAQSDIYDSNEPEIGVAEHLGDTLPMDLIFNNEQGENVRLGDVINKPTIITLVYFDCPGLCSPLLDGVSEVMEQMDLTLGTDYDVLTVSFNTEDTPERAVEKKQNFLKKRSLEQAEHWVYLTGDSANIAQLVDAIGFKYKKAGNDWIHAAVITVVSPTGKITRYLYGTRFLPFDVKMAIGEAAKGISRPTINRVLEFCFSYDPSGRRYVLDVTKVSGIVILFVGLVIFITLIIRSRNKKRKNESQSTNS
ncbi:MAG: SCO family protein [Bacteroidales bacterium]|nr:SCO family protein [Bacteroidales bacterium]